ncbi:unnamed protein product [Schistocephalus solidus]|uniref:RNA polymerase-associated protein LEO1 n=1 Tax=Schistocephalus solidus TaxID=70667 RepID=A0A183TG23_SCHSO|nr:unnamed protein product [Schistocephalus solidus]
MALIHKHFGARTSLKFKVLSLQKTEVFEDKEERRSKDIDSDSAEEQSNSPQKLTARDVLGSSSSEESEQGHDTPVKTRSLSVSSRASSEQSILGSSKHVPESNERDDSEAEELAADHEVTEEAGETRIAVAFPLIRVDLGREMHLVKMPNFLSVETRPFDPAVYEDELDEDEVLDEEGRTRLKLKVENTIRWRLGKNEAGETIHESNARIVRWSDGSLSLYLGNEIFDVHKMDIQSDFNHLFIREGSGLQGQAVFKTKLTFRQSLLRSFLFFILPHSTESFTHRKITLSLADKTNKSQKVKILPVAGADPESNRHALVRKEEERLRASLRRESQQRRMRERQLASAAHRNRRSSLTVSGYGDDENSLDEGTSISLAAIKRDTKAGRSSSTRRSELVFLPRP